MSWRDLLSKVNEVVVAPWLGGRLLRAGARTWTIHGALPAEHGWYSFTVEGRRVRTPVPFEPALEQLQDRMTGYLVGDHLVPDGVAVPTDPALVAEHTERVHLLDLDVDRFARVTAGRPYEDGPLVFAELAFPLGPEEEVYHAYLDQRDSVAAIKGVTPGLDAAFRMENWQRAEAERRRVELEKRRQEEEARRLAEERRQQLVEQLGDGAGRRAMAQVDFAVAARAALVVGGAELLDCRKQGRAREWAVRYRLDGDRYECIVDETLHIIDSGICLNNYVTGEKGDTWFTLESLPAVVRDAKKKRKLVVFRHV